MVWVYSRTARRAEEWARRAGLKRGEFRVFGEWSRLEGYRYAPGDQVVVVGDLPPRIGATVVQLHRRSPHDLAPIRYVV